MVHIFISYSKKDTLDLALHLYEALTAIPGITAWMDVSLESGESWAAQIQEEIDRADLVVVLLSPDVNRKERRSFVLNELDYAQQEHKLIIPVMAQPTRMPVQIAGIQYLSLMGDEDKALGSLVNSIVRRAGVIPPSEPMAGNPILQADFTGKQRKIGVVAAVVVLIVLAIAAVALLSARGPEPSVVTPTTSVAALDTATNTATDAPTNTTVPTLTSTVTILPTTPTPTMNMTASTEALRTELAATAIAQYIIEQTATADSWTATPTHTRTATSQPILTRIQSPTSAAASASEYPCNGELSGIPGEVYVGRSTTTQVKFRIERGSQVRILGKEPDLVGVQWYEIEFNRESGWIPADKITPSFSCPQ